MKNITIENQLLATHITANEGFESACLSGNSDEIRNIVTSEMEKNKLFTKGANKLKADIFRMLGDKPKVSVSTGQNVLGFVWNSRLSGIGLSVLN